MNEIETRALGKYARLRPEDRDRTTVYASEETLKAVTRDIRERNSINFPDPEEGIPVTLFGLPVRIDDAVPFGDWRFMVEVKQMGALEDRRQNARVAASNAATRSPRYYELRAATEAAIEVATRVRITDEVINAFRAQAGNYERGLRAAFETAGFEVIE